MKYLTDSEIIGWGKELNLMLNPLYSNKTGHPDIKLITGVAVREYPNVSNSRISNTNNSDTLINYKFVFSISENRVNDFYKILDKALSKGLGTKFLIDKDHDRWGEINTDVSMDIKIDSSIFNLSSVSHEIWNRNFVRFTYDFKAHFTSVMSYISFLKDTIDYISMVWSYNENGEEINLLKYNIGDVVSTSNDRSKDYIVIDYDLISSKNGKYINYKISEILSERNSPIIRYGSIKSLTSDEISFSRNNRIDDILGTN